MVLMDLTHTGGKEGERRGWAGLPKFPTADVVVTGNRADDRVFVDICLSLPKTTLLMVAAVRNWESDPRRTKCTW